MQIKNTIYKGPKPVPYGSVYAAHTTNQNPHLLTGQTNTKDKSHTKEHTFRKMEV